MSCFAKFEIVRGISASRRDSMTDDADLDKSPGRVGLKFA
jgi:hypothetical protein